MRATLKDGEEYCPSCKGTGCYKDFIHICRKCEGSGKVDWVSKVMNNNITPLFSPGYHVNITQIKNRLSNLISKNKINAAKKANNYLDTLRETGTIYDFNSEISGDSDSNTIRYIVTLELHKSTIVTYTFYIYKQKKGIENGR